MTDISVLTRVPAAVVSRTSATGRECIAGYRSGFLFDLGRLGGRWRMVPGSFLRVGNDEAVALAETAVGL